LWAIVGVAALGVTASGCSSRRGNTVDPEVEPPPPQKIVFASDRDESHGEIYVMDSDSLDARRLTTNAVQDAAPLLSPDGSKITFRRELSPASVFVMNVDGSHQIGLAPGKRAEWSPDGSKLALVADSLCTMNADGTGKRCFGVGASYASWKPDGTKIAYVATGLGGQHANDIYVINANGTSPTRLTTDGVARTSLAWSPDGTKMVYSAAGTITVIDADGSNATSPGTGEGARWSPDGVRVIYATDAHDGNQEIYSSRVDGSERQNLTYNFADDTDPDWGPRP
jgi:Tol biopolymer transport system component